jgi:hypothetical protein
MATPYKTPSPRAPNLVRADSETVTSSDGLRRVTFRNAKLLLPGHRYDVVRVAQLKDWIAGKWVIRASAYSEEAGRAFLESGKIN